MLTLRPYQQECIDAFYNYYESGKSGNGLLVLPTAAGKSVLLGKLITEICQKWPDQRVLLLSHIQELIIQNHSKIMLCWPKAPAGIYSASLNRRQPHFPIVTASIQSVYKKADLLGPRDLLFVDECHMMAPGNAGMYSELIVGLLAMNPNMKICGASATPYRTDSGALHQIEGALFDDVIIDIPIQRLLDEGYITPPIGKHQLMQADMHGVKITAGEYNIKQMAAKFDQKEFIDAALDSDMEAFKDRKSIALFCATVENAEHVAAAMTARGIHTETLDGEMNAVMRKDRLDRFRSGELRGLASVGVMTTGTDIPNMDCLVIFRATQSPGLYQQIVGRGFRVVYAEGADISTAEARRAAIANGPKPNFIVLDHGGNIDRHGPITSVTKPQVREKGERRPAERSKIKVCEMCRTANTLEALTCVLCGVPLKDVRNPTAGLDVHASTADIMGTPFSRGEVAQWFKVDRAMYNLHRKADSPDSLRVTYECGVMFIEEWIHFERHGHKRRAAEAWWRERTSGAIPVTSAQAIKMCESLKSPSRIQVRKRDKFYDVLRYEFTTEEKLYAEPLHAAGAN